MTYLTKGAEISDFTHIIFDYMFTNRDFPLSPVPLPGKIRNIENLKGVILLKVTSRHNMVPGLCL